MAEAPLPEIFPQVTLFVKQKEYETVRQKYSGVEIQESGSYLKASGSFKDIEGVYLESLSKQEKGQHGAPTRRSNGYELNKARMMSAASARVEPVEVDNVIMNYINEKCSEELSKIKQPGVSMQFNKKQVTFHHQDTEHGTVLAQLLRERFITFYQKKATQLQSRSYSLSPSVVKPLLEKYPELLLSSDPMKLDKVTLTGRFIHLERFEQLFTGPKKSSPRQFKDRVSMDATGTRKTLQKETTDKEETCSICLELIVKSQMKILDKCKHCFCKDCLKRAFEIKPVCPTCGVIYGALRGTQPKGGKMHVTYDSSSLPGYKGYGTIIIHYVIPDGIQGDEHPNPGQPYKGAVRMAYLPNNKEGSKVLELLKLAFEQRLTFTVGRSSTTGKSNVVTWNDIHHKTSQVGGPTAYGYPDPDYLKRVQEELKVKGIC